MSRKSSSLHQARAGTGQEDAARRDRLQRQPVHVEILLQGVDRPPRGRASAWPDRAPPRRSAAPLAIMSRSQGNRSACTKRTRGLFSLAFCRGQREGLLVEIDADHLVGLAERLGVDGEAAGVAAQIEHALAAAERGEALAIVALIEEEAGLVLAAGGDAEPHAMLGDDAPAAAAPAVGSRTIPASARAPRRTSRTALSGNARPARPSMAARKRYMPAAKNSSTIVVAEAIDDQPAQPVALGMDEAIGVGDGVESEPVAAQRDGRGDAAGEEGVVDGFVRIAGQHAQGDARMAVVEAAADPLAVAVDDVHDAAGRQARRPASRPSSGRSTDATTAARS